MIQGLKRVWPWLGNVFEAVFTVLHGLWITLRTWIKTYDPERILYPLKRVGTLSQPRMHCTCESNPSSSMWRAGRA